MTVCHFSHIHSCSNPALNSGSLEYKSSHLTARLCRLPSRSLEVRNPCLLRPYEIVYVYFVLLQTFFKITRRLYTMRDWGKLVYRSICKIHFVSKDTLRRFVSTMVWDLLASSKSALGLLQFFFACRESVYYNCSSNCFILFSRLIVIYIAIIKWKVKSPQSRTTKIMNVYL